MHQENSPQKKKKLFFYQFSECVVKIESVLSHPFSDIFPSLFKPFDPALHQAIQIHAWNTVEGDIPKDLSERKWGRGAENKCKKIYVKLKCVFEELSLSGLWVQNQPLESPFPCHSEAEMHTAFWLPLSGYEFAHSPFWNNVLNGPGNVYLQRNCSNFQVFLKFNIVKFVFKKMTQTQFFPIIITLG